MYVRITQERSNSIIKCKKPDTETNMYSVFQYMTSHSNQENTVSFVMEFFSLFSNIKIRELSTNKQITITL